MLQVANTETTYLCTYHLLTGDGYRGKRGFCPWEGPPQYREYQLQRQIGQKNKFGTVISQIMEAFDGKLSAGTVRYSWSGRERKQRWSRNLDSKLIHRVLYGYTQYPIIRNGLIRNNAEFLGKFKKQALGRSNLRNASKNLRNSQCSDFQS